MRSVTAGAEDVSTYVMLADSASGAPETGYTIADLDLSYVRELLAPSAKVDAVALSPAAPTTAHTDNRAIEIDATDMEGLYRVDWPDAAFAAGVSQVTLYVKGVGLAPAVETVMIGAPVDVTAISGDTAAADNAELDYDGTGYSKSNSTIGTCTTLTGNTVQTADHAASIAAILEDTGTTLQAELDGIQADTEDIQSRIPAALVGGRIDANAGAISADATAADNLEAMLDGTGGVTLSLGQLAIVASSNDDAIIASGAGTGAGIVTTGGATGIGFEVVGGGTSGDAIKASATSGDGMSLAGGTNGVGLLVAGAGAGHGFRANGGATGHGIIGYAGSSDKSGIVGTGQGAGAGLKVSGGTTGYGIEVIGGPTSGDAINASATDGHGMYLAGGENNEGFEAAGEGTAAGMSLKGGSEGDGLYATSGWNAGEGIYAYGLSATSDGFKVEAGGSGKDINAAEIDSIISKVDVVDGIADNILLDTAEIGTAGDGLTAVPWNAAWDAEVQSECADALTAYDPPTKAEMDSAHSTTDALITTVDGIVDNILLDTAEIGTAGAGLTAVSNQVWSASVHPGSTGTGLKLYDISVDTAEIGTAGAGLTEAGGTGDHLGDLGGMSTAMKAEVNAEADTALADYDGPTNAEMEARTILSASYFDPAADTVANVTTVATLTGHTAQTADHAANVAAILEDTGTTLPATLATIDGNVDSILSDTGTEGVVLSSATMNSISAALLDLTDGVETGVTVRQAHRAFMAAMAAKVSGMDTLSPKFRDQADTKNRISATVDVSGNRSEITLDLT